MRLNLCSGELPLEGWTNVDLYTEADIVGDVRLLHFTNIEEVRMSHGLEHISHRDVPSLLSRIRSWMAPGASVTIEVPDMGAISAHPGHPLWEVYTYGGQQHEGEHHRSGYTADSLADHLARAGFFEVGVRAFKSDHPNRPGMPCLEGTARA